ncbi:MAG: hypothetical protein AAFQ84_04655, partial [Pseudomonadota bacterium]
IQAKAQLLQTTGATWSVPVRDNTNGNALYVLAGSLTNSGTADSVRDLNAPSGSNGVDFTSERTAGPFAILDEILDSLQLVESVAPTQAFPDFQVFWSVNNVPADGEIADGEINSSSFTTGSSVGNVPTILILGDMESDTDEYDEHVVTHEFGHYFETLVSRSDTIGGSHSLSSILDSRLAWSEGWANAVAAMITDDPIYIDSNFGSNGGFAFNVELNSLGQTAGSNGWYGEASIQSIVYDIFDSANDGADTISAGFAPIFNTFSDPDFLESDAPITIFSWIDVLRTQPGISATAIDALLSVQDINGVGPFGDGETNDGGIPSGLPVVQTVTIGGGPIEICSTDDEGTFNNLGVRTLIRLNVATAGNLTFTMERVSGDFGRDPDFLIFAQGDFVNIADSAATDIEQEVIFLSPNDYIIEALDFNNLDLPDSGTAGDACYDFSVN